MADSPPLPTVQYEYELHRPDGTCEVLLLDTDPVGVWRGGVGSTVWDCSLVLSKYLERVAGRLAGKSALELGAGCGLAGAVFRALGGAAVTLTDQPRALPLLARSAARLFPGPASGVAVAPLAWGNAAHLAALPSTTVDFVLLADCLYAPPLYGALLDTLRGLYIREGVWIAYERRDFAQEMHFFAALGKDFAFKDIPAAEQDPVFQSPDIYLFFAKPRRPSSIKEE